MTYLIRIGELKLPSIARPRDERLARFVHQQFEQKLPQLNRSRSGKTWHTLRPVHAHHALVRHAGHHGAHIGGMLMVVAGMTAANEAQWTVPLR